MKKNGPQKRIEHDVHVGFGVCTFHIPSGQQTLIIPQAIWRLYSRDYARLSYETEKPAISP